MKIYVWGYWEKNLGDDLFLVSLCEIYKKLNKDLKDIVIMASQKNKHYYESFGISVIIKDSFIFKLINRLSITRIGVERFYINASGNIFLMLGGSLFSEDKRIENEKQQISNLTYAVNNAQYSYVIGSNFGPYRTEWFYSSYYKIFTKCDSVCFRDEYSQKLFEGIANVKYAPDVVLEGKWDCFLSTVGKQSVVISVIDLDLKPTLKQYRVQYENFIRELVEYHIGEGDHVVLVSFCEQQGDEIACSRICSCINSDEVEIEKYKDIGRIINLFKEARKVYATRFHAMILAMYFRVSCIPIVYDPKTVHALEAYCDKFEYLDVRKLNSQSLLWAVEDNSCFQMKDYLIRRNEQFFDLIEDLKNGS